MSDRGKIVKTKDIASLRVRVLLTEDNSQNPRRVDTKWLTVKSVYDIEKAKRTAETMASDFWPAPLGFKWSADIVQCTTKTGGK